SDAALRIALYQHALVADLQAPAAGSRDPVELGLDPATCGADAARVGERIRQCAARAEPDECADITLDPVRLRRPCNRVDTRIAGGRHEIGRASCRERARVGE